jgi:hypothetical protein
MFCAKASSIGVRQVGVQQAPTDARFINHINCTTSKSVCLRVHKDIDFRAFNDVILLPTSECPHLFYPTDLFAASSKGGVEVLMEAFLGPQKTWLWFFMVVPASLGLDGAE